MKKIQFIFGIHLHQPVGNFDWVFEDAYQKSYRPFLDILNRYPKLSIVIHISGPLIEWLEINHPEYLDELAELVSLRNIEILSAGFYEPVLAVIPDHDKKGQIKKMNKYIKSRFDQTAEGLWLTERVWEPHLAKPIAKADINYIAVDDYHFLSAGKQIGELDGYYTTDEQNSRLGIFPISQKLRYAIPFEEPKVTIDHLKSVATERGDNVIVMVDDAEKFGVWPGTNKTCYGENKWLARFFHALEKNSDWITTTTLKKYYNSNKPKGRIYLPTVSYFEMSEWTLPASQGGVFTDFVHKVENEGNIEKYRPYLRGGMWRNFQNLYDESNWMQKRISDMSAIFNKNKKKFPKPLRKQIRDNIWQAQCNCAYWHGVFGGLYLPHLRHGIYSNLIAADQEITKLLPKFKGTYDIDNDGFDEVDLVSDNIKIIASTKGGCIREFDIFSKNFNLLNTMHQAEESYHRDIKKATTDDVSGGSIHDNILAKEANLEKVLNIDKYPRYMLIDRFLSKDSKLNDVWNSSNDVANFSELEYKVKKNDKIKFNAQGKVNNSIIEIDKTFELSENDLTIEIELQSISANTVNATYACELNYALLGGHSDDRYYKINGEKPQDYYLDFEGMDKNVESIEIVNEYDKFSVLTVLDSPTNLWRHPIFTVSGSEAGLEKVYQSSVVIPHWQLNLKPNEKQNFKLKIIVKEL